MLAEKVDEELSEFDLRHFCDGNPVYCYYFRLPALQTELPNIETALRRPSKSIPAPPGLMERARAPP